MTSSLGGVGEIAFKRRATGEVFEKQILERNRASAIGPTSLSIRMENKTLTASIMSMSWIHPALQIRHKLRLKVGF